jgi:hypothetical protein
VTHAAQQITEVLVLCPAALYQVERMSLEVPPAAGT